MGTWRVNTHFIEETLWDNKLCWKEQRYHPKERWTENHSSCQIIATSHEFWAPKWWYSKNSPASFREIYTSGWWNIVFGQIHPINTHILLDHKSSTIIPRDPITLTENGLMEPKYLSFRRWWRTPLAHHLRRWARNPLGHDPFRSHQDAAVGRKRKPTTTYQLCGTVPWCFFVFMAGQIYIYHHPPNVPTYPRHKGLLIVRAVLILGFSFSKRLLNLDFCSVFLEGGYVFFGKADLNRMKKTKRTPCKPCKPSRPLR